MTTKKLINCTNEPASFKFDKSEVVAGYAFMGAWVGLVVGFTGLVGPEYSSEVSLGLAVVGALIGLRIANRN